MLTARPGCTLCPRAARGHKLGGSYDCRSQVFPLRNASVPWGPSCEPSARADHGLLVSIHAMQNGSDEQMPGPTDVDEVWAKYVAGDSGFKLEGGFLWELPDGLRTVVTDRCKVYVRDVYVKWIDMLFNLHKMDKRGLMIRGTPGIGKSVGLDCLLAYLGEQKRTVLLHRKGDRFYVLHKTGSVKIVSGSVIDYYLFGGYGKDVVYVVDGAIALESRLLTFVSVSPRKVFVNEFKKDEANLVLIGPPWTLEELEAVRLAFFDGLITAEELKERFEYVGGSARECLKLDPYYSAREELDIWLKEFGDIKQLVAEGMQARRDDGVPSKVVHWYPSGKDDAGPHKPRLCSAEAFQRVRSALSSSTGLAEMYHKLCTFAEAAQVYEDWVLARLDADDNRASLLCKVIRVRLPEKVDKQKRPTALALVDEHKRLLGPHKTVMFNTIEDLHTLMKKYSSTGVLYRPANRNQEVVDAIYVPPTGRIVLFQITTERKRLLDGNKVSTFLDKLCPEEGSLASLATRKFQFVFVSPSEVAKGGGKDGRIPRLTRWNIDKGQKMYHVIEYVLAADVSSPKE